MCMQMNKIDCYQMAMDYFIPVSIVEDLSRQNEFDEDKTRQAVEGYICDMENYYEGFGAYYNDDGFRS